MTPKQIENLKRLAAWLLRRQNMMLQDRNAADGIHALIAENEAQAARIKEMETYIERLEASQKQLQQSEAMCFVSKEYKGKSFLLPVFGEVDTGPLPAQDVNEHKPNCKECAKWVQEQADNREWIEGVKRGNEIVAALAAAKQKE